MQKDGDVCRRLLFHFHRSVRDEEELGAARQVDRRQDVGYPWPGLVACCRGEDWQMRMRIDGKCRSLWSALSRFLEARGRVEMVAGQSLSMFGEDLVVMWTDFEGVVQVRPSTSLVALPVGTD